MKKHPFALGFTAALVALLAIGAAYVGPWAPSPFSQRISTNTTATAWRTALSVTNATGLEATAVNLTTVSNTVTTHDNVLATNTALLAGTNALTGTNRFTGTVLITNAASTISGNGAGLTNLAAGNIASGTLANARTTATDANTASAIVARDASGNFTAGTITAATFSGSGASLTSLPAGQLTGSIADARLSSNVPLKNSANVFSAVITNTSMFWFTNSGSGAQPGIGIYNANSSATNGAWVDTYFLNSSAKPAARFGGRQSATYGGDFAEFALWVASGSGFTGDPVVTWNYNGQMVTAGGVQVNGNALVAKASGSSDYIAMIYGNPASWGNAIYAQDSFGVKIRSGGNNVFALDYLGRLGANNQSPSAMLDTVAASASVAGVKVKLAASQTADALQIYNSSAAKILGIDANGVIVLPTNTSAPSTITGSGQIYSLQTAGTAEIFVKDGAGNATQISPHARGSLPPEGKSIDDGKHPFPIIVHHQNVYVGEEEWVNLTALAAAVEKLTGQKLSYKRKLADGLKANWEADQDRQQAVYFAERQRELEEANRWQSDTSDRKGTNAPAVRGPFVRMVKPDHVR